MPDKGTITLVHTGQAIGWYRCDGKGCPLCERYPTPPIESETVGPMELVLADLALRCPKCASPALTSTNDRRHRCLHCMNECTDETAMPSVMSLRKKSYQEGYTAGSEKQFEETKCNRCQTTCKTVRVSTGFAGEEEHLCGGCVADEIERLEEIIKRQP